MRNSKISRRKALHLAGGGLAGVIAAPAIIRRSLAAGQRELVISSWGGSYQAAQREAYFDPFEKATGIKVIGTSAPLPSKVKAQYDAGNVEWDVIVGGARWYPVLKKQGLVQPLDMARLGNTKDLLPGFVGTHGVAHAVVSQVLAYNKNHFKGDKPSGWVDFWDVEKFPGPRSLGKDVTFALEYALIADGVDGNNLYPLDVDRAFKKLEQIRDHIKTWWAQGSQPIQLLGKGEVIMSSAWNGRVVAAEEKGLPITLVWQGGSFMPDYFMIPTNAKNVDEAYEFLNFSALPEAQAAFSSIIYYGPSNPKALDMISDDVKQKLNSHPDNLVHQWPFNGDWLAEHFDALNDRWQKFLIG